MRLDVPRVPVGQQRVGLEAMAQALLDARTSISPTLNIALTPRPSYPRSILERRCLRNRQAGAETTRIRPEAWREPQRIGAIFTGSRCQNARCPNATSGDATEGAHFGSKRHDDLLISIPLPWPERASGLTRKHTARHFLQTERANIAEPIGWLKLRQPAWSIAS